MLTAGPRLTGADQGAWVLDRAAVDVGRVELRAVAGDLVDLLRRAPRPERVGAGGADRRHGECWDCGEGYRADRRAGGGGGPSEKGEGADVAVEVHVEQARGWRQPATNGPPTAGVESAHT
jgi:hypothetical protein